MPDKAVRPGQTGSGADLLVRGVQTAVTDIVRHGAGEKVGILQNHAQGPAQGVLGNIPHIDAVVGNGTALDLIKAVDEAGDGGLARAGGAHKGDLLPGLCKEGYVVQNDPIFVVTKHHMIEPHVSPEGDQRTVRLQPGPGVVVIVDPGEAAGGIFCRPHQHHFALVCLRLGLHHLKNPFRAGHSGEDGVHLLGNLGDGLAHLPGVLEESPQISQPEGPAAVNGEHGPQTAADGVVDIVQVSHGGHHSSGVGVGPGGRLAVRLVPGIEALLCGGLMVEDFDDLLTLDHLLDVSVDLTQGLLLSREIPPAAAADGPHYQQHHRQHGKGDERQGGTQHQHHDNGAQKIQRAGDHTAKAVVQSLGDGLNIVGIAAHQLAVGVGVEVFQRQSLHPFKEIRPDFRHTGLGDMHHNPGVAKRAHRPGNIHCRHEAQHFRKPRKISGQDIVIDQGLDKIGAPHGAGGADTKQHYHHRQQRFVPPQVTHQLPQRAADILRFLKAAFRTMMSRAARPHRSFILSHRCSPLPAGTGIRPGISHSSPSAPHGSPGRQSGRRPSPESCPRPARRPPAGR